MGRLGFNLVRQNELSKNVEAGAPPDKQNEKNESAEMKELAVVVGDECKKSRKNLRGLMVFVTMIITFSAYIAVIRLRPFYHSTVDPNANKILSSYLTQSELSQAQKNESNEANSQQTVNCMKVLSMYVSLALANYRRELNEEKMLHVIEVENVTMELSAAKESLETLRADYDELKAQSAKREEHLRAELERLQGEHADLLKKLQIEPAPATSISSRSPTATSTATSTPNPTKDRLAGFFNNEPFKKMNDIVKHIEAGTSLFRIEELLRKAEDFGP